MSYSRLIVSKVLAWPISSITMSDPQCCFVCERASLAACCVELFSRGTCSVIHFASGIQCAHSPSSAVFHCAHYVV